MRQKVRDLVCEQLSEQCAPCASCAPCIPRSDPMRPSATQVLAAQTLKIASINGLGDTEKLETELEDEICWEESRRPPREILGRARRRCEEILHVKSMLLFIVLLNVIDCLLVIGELTLDFHHLSNRYLARVEHTEDFLDKMKARSYPSPLAGLESVGEDNEEDMTRMFDHFLHGFVFWNASGYSQHDLATDCHPFVSPSNNNSSSFPQWNSNTTIFPTNVSSSNSSGNVLWWLLSFASSPVEPMGPMDREHYDVVGTAHALHYASLSILSFLLAETILKILCVGRRFINKRMEVFDAVIVTVSFTLDVIFVEGLNTLHIQHYVIVLSFLLPWRVLRVLNSLIVAVMIQHRFHLKLLYKQKRKINKQLQESAGHIKTMEKQVELLKNLCSSNGIPEWQINKATGNTLSSSGQSGLKALTKLVFHAAESFAPFSGSQSHLNQIANGGNGTITATTTTTDLISASPSTPSITINYGGDLEQGGPSCSTANGHVHALQEESHMEDETVTPTGSPPGTNTSRSWSVSSDKDSGHESRPREEEDDGKEKVGEACSGIEGVQGLSEGKEKEEERNRRQQDGEEKRREEEEMGRVGGDSWNTHPSSSSSPPIGPDDFEDMILNLHTSTTRL